MDDDANHGDGSAVRIVGADAVVAALDWRRLSEAIAEILVETDRAAGPPRWVLPAGGTLGHEFNLLVMPSWHAEGPVGIKVVTHVPGNAERGEPVIRAAYLAFDPLNGTLSAVIDGEALTARRTAALSALAGRWTIRPDARRLLVIGTGQLAVPLVEAHRALHPFDHVEVWGRTPSRAAAVAAASGASAVTDLELAVRDADVIVTATAAAEPLVRGAWVQPGTHVSLIGSYQPSMCEADADLILTATVFADTRPGALLAGELHRPIAEGHCDESVIVAELADLVAGRHPGRTTAEEITVFESVGFALADLAAARVVLTGERTSEP
ncbi:MAG: ornithine cyclodeaminase family protein [Ilumatobacteraceae bacterium]